MNISRISVIGKNYAQTAKLSFKSANWTKIPSEKLENSFLKFKAADNVKKTQEQLIDLYSKKLFMLSSKNSEKINKTSDGKEIIQLLKKNREIREIREAGFTIFM